MRRLESEHLAALANGRLDLSESCAAAGGDHQLRGLVGDDAIVAARIVNLAFERLAVEVLGAAAAQSELSLRRCRGADLLRPVAQDRFHDQSKDKPSIALTVQSSVAGVRPWPIPKLTDHDFASYSAMKYRDRKSTRLKSSHAT